MFNATKGMDMAETPLWKWLFTIFYQKPEDFKLHNVQTQRKMWIKNPRTDDTLQCVFNSARKVADLI
jgi:hypothetical protein